MSLTYTTWLNQLANMMVIPTTDANFITFVPGCIDYAEQRMYRELDLQVSRVVDSSATFTANTRNFTLPTQNGTFLVVEQMNAITPVGTGASQGTRNPLSIVTKEWMDFTYPSATAGTGVPQYFAPINNTVYEVGPSPDANYTVEVIGTQRPAALSVTNTTTFLTTILPDAFFAASMVFAAGYQRDFGAQTDNPQASLSWETQYGKLMASANVEELRKRFMAPAWQAMTPAPTATPPRV